MIGKTISHYKILEKLGEGGMGVVYKAHDTKLTRKVALKFLSKHTLQSEQEKARFLREAQAASLLDHPNICTLYDTYEVEGETFIAMAYCDGQRLDEKLAMGPLSVGEAVSIAIQVAEGLKAAHKKGVIHRDIKSANIMITEEGQAKIMDFGLAKVTGRTKLTETATIMGTVDYMSPEQARGETVDHRTDIWSLGVVLYEMLTGRVPFNGESDAAMVHKIIYEEPADLASIAPDTPLGLIAVVSRAMAKDRDDRYASAAEFLEDIRNYEFLPPEKMAFAEKRAGTRALSTAMRVMPKGKRISTAVAAVAILTFLSVALLWLFQRPQTSDQAEPSKKDQEIHFCTTSDGVRIAYATSGEGDPPLVRVLGWLTHLEYEWENPLTRPFYDVGAGHLLVRYDGRGMGLSDREVSDFSLEARVRDLEAVVDDLGLERFALYGVSEGGPTAITYAVRHPERVSHLILYGAYASGRKYHSELGKEELDTRLALVRQGWGSDVPAHRQFFAGLFMPDADGEAIRVFTELQRVSAGAENAVALITANWDMDVTQLLDQVAAPTLVIHRRGDVVVPFERGRELAAGIPGAQFLPLDGRNHAILPDDPVLEIRNKAIEEFLSENFETTAKTERISEEKAHSSIAVLPFEDMSEAKDQEYFCDGISEELINGLSRFEDLRVIARTSAFSFKGKDIDLHDIGKKLNVETILEGSVRRSGNKLRIAAQLNDAADNSEIWRGQYEKEMKDIFALQDEITEAIVEKLQVELLGGEHVGSAKRHAVDPEVYDLYLRGRYFWNKATAGDMNKAIEYFQKAAEKDPNYALAYAGMADYYTMLPFNAPFPMPKEVYPKARAAALKAVEIDDTLAETHTSLAVVKVFGWKWEEAEEEFRQAIEINPGYASAHYFYAGQLMFMRRFDEAVREIERARELDPLSPRVNREFGTILFYASQYDRAIETLQRTIEIAPNMRDAHGFLGATYYDKGMYEEALAEFEEEELVSGAGDPFIATWTALTYVRMGKKAEAQKILDDMLERSKQTHVTPYQLANLCFAVGDNDRGFEFLDKAYEDGDYWLCWVGIGPAYDIVRSDPRYIAMLKKINLEP